MQFLCNIPADYVQILLNIPADYVQFYSKFLPIMCKILAKRYIMSEMGVL